MCVSGILKANVIYIPTVTYFSPPQGQPASQANSRQGLSGHKGGGSRVKLVTGPSVDHGQSFQDLAVRKRIIWLANPYFDPFSKSMSDDGKHFLNIGMSSTFNQFVSSIQSNRKMDYMYFTIKCNSSILSKQKEKYEVGIVKDCAI